MNKVANDYELIYLIQCHQDGVALEYMFKKYEKMIWKYIVLYQVREQDKEDFFQEGLILLNKAIMVFNEKYNKTFTRYFELIIKRHIIYLKNKIPKTILYDNLDLFGGVDFVFEEDEIKIDLKAHLEQEIYEKYFLKKEKVSKIARDLGLLEKQIYNAIFRVKKKIKNRMNID